MPIFNQDLSRFKAAFADLLLPGETLIGLEMATIAAGASRIERDTILGFPIPKRDRADPGKPSLGRRVAGAALGILTGTIDIDDRHLPGGITATGSGASTAAAIYGIGREGDFDSLAVTDRRLLFVDEGTSGATLIVALDRRELTSFRAHPTLLQRGRIELGFADGSTLSIKAGVLIRRASRRLLAALEASG